MMQKTTLLCALGAIGTTSALVAPYPAQRDCHDLMLKVPVSTTTYHFNVPRVDNNIDAVVYSVDSDRRTAPNITERVLSELQLNATFNIWGRVCLPDASKDKHIMQILSHGAIFDHRYWDSEVDPEQYSYVKAAVDAGYTVLNYDRLGCGLSDKPDAYDVVQEHTELEILRHLTEMARDGSLVVPSTQYPGTQMVTLPGFDKVVHVGHSYGSELTGGLLAKYGNLSSGAVSTGFVVASHPTSPSTASVGLEYAAENNPALYGGFGSGYLVPATVSNLQNSFFHRDNDTDASGFTNEGLAYGDSIKQPVSIGVWSSLRGLLSTGYSPEFTGPLQYFLAEYDNLVCGGDCKDDYDPAVIAQIYPNATTIDYHIQPGAGHGLTLHQNASAGYKVTLDWLAANGL